MASLFAVSTPYLVLGKENEPLESSKDIELAGTLENMVTHCKMKIVTRFGTSPDKIVIIISL